MGTQVVSGNPSPAQLRLFMQRLLDDVWALETMLRKGQIESGVARIGAEQEMVMVEGAYRPAPINLEVLEALNDDMYTTELARFNVELNLPPLPFSGDCLSVLHRELSARVQRVKEAARSKGAEVVLTGILPTLRLQDLELENMTPFERYRALNEAISRLRGNDYEMRINGADELIVKHDTVMLESCNTSFQVHLQVDPERFAQAYNVAQLVAAPIVAAAANSPILFGRRLWHETRVAVFQQAVDTRTSSYYLQNHSSRVSFGRRWVDESALELFQEDIARFRVLLGCEGDPQEPFKELEEGRIPKLEALQLHNSTVYRWNRACYGISKGKPHLRIENRVLPSGPTVVDEVANAAFWFGLMKGIPERCPDVREKLTFEEVRANFVAAARRGLGAQLNWIDEQMHPAPQLILEQLLPIAHEGLQAVGIDEGDRQRYLGIIEARVRSRRTGAQWLLDSFARMRNQGTASQQLCALTAASIANEESGKPVHEWPLAGLTGAHTTPKHSYMRVEQIMTTDVVTVNQEELLDLVARIMDWNNIRYVPVESDDLQLVGLVSHRALLRYLARDCSGPEERRSTPVRQIMHRLEDDLFTVSPETLTLEALNLMRTHRIGCLPVTSRDGRLVGMVTERNFLQVAGQMLEQKLKE